jgi:hypothetical protein
MQSELYSAQDYYDNRDEFDYVGILDQELKKNQNLIEISGEFKIRSRRLKILS